MSLEIVPSGWVQGRRRIPRFEREVCAGLPTDGVRQTVIAARRCQLALLVVECIIGLWQAPCRLPWEVRQ
jgi:hypothetical protein